MHLEISTPWTRNAPFILEIVIISKRVVVPVAAVRDLYGTMIAEGATKGILVTTAHCGRDTRIFIKDKPTALIDGTNLVYLLEDHGHKVRIDVKAARADIEKNRLNWNTIMGLLFL